ncbi:MAG: hypothetical protein QXT93_11350 [Thermofilum sp.]
MRRRGRLVEHIVTDSVVDLAFVATLLKNPGRLGVIEKQAEAFIETGDLGYDALAFKRYEKEALAEVVSMLRSIYGTSSLKTLKREAESKAKRAWTALVLFRALTRLLGAIYPEAEDLPSEKKLIPRVLEDPEKMLKAISVIIETKVAEGKKATTMAIKRAMKRIEDMGLDPRDFSVFLWWINIIMEAEVIDAVADYKYIVYVDRKHKLVENFMWNLSSATEGRLKAPPDKWLEFELRKALLSWTAGLKGQYINKLQNAILFIKLWRKSEKPEKLQSWSWFLPGEPLMYSLAVYLVEPQLLLDMRMPIKLPLERLMTAKDPRELSFLTLLMFSPIIHLHGVETGEPKVTPMDVVVSLLRISRRAREERPVGLAELTEELKKFYEDTGLADNMRARLRQLDLDKLAWSESLNWAIASLVITGVPGIGTILTKKEIFKLPPRKIPYDAVYLKPRELSEFVRKALGG